MKLRTARLVPLVLSVPALIGSISRAEAQVSDPPPASVTVQGDLSQLVQWLQAHATDSTQQATLQGLQDQVANLTPDQLAAVTSAVATSSDVNSFDALVNRLMSHDVVVSRTPKAGPAPLGPITATLFPPPYGVCDPAVGSVFFGSQVPSNDQGIFDITETIDVLKTAIDILNYTVCQTTFVVAGSGTNVAGCVAVMLLTEIVDGMQFDKDGFTFCDNSASQAEVTAAWQNTKDIDSNLAKLSDSTANGLQDVTNQLTGLDTDISNRALAIEAALTNVMASANTDIDNRLSNAETDLINKSTAVDTDINNHLNQVDTDVLNRATQIDNEIGTLQTLHVRSQIEQALAGNLTVGLFELPLASGGYLETVRSIVNDTISKLVAAGQAVNGATKWLGLGDTALAAKQYKAAYANYLTAYITAVK